MSYELYKDRLNSGVSIPTEGGTKQVELAYPDQIKIQHKDGAVIDVELVARNLDKVQFRRLADDGIFIYPIQELSEKTRDLVQRYPNLGLKDAGSFIGTGELTLAEAHAEQIKERINELDAELRTIGLGYERSESKVERLTLRRQSEVLQRERRDLSMRIEAQ